MSKLCDELRASVLQAAIQGKLVSQNLEEGTGEELFLKIQEEKKKIISNGKRKKEKELPVISEDEKAFKIHDRWVWARLADITIEMPTNGYSIKEANHPTSIKNLTLSATTSGVFKADAFKYVDVAPEIAAKYSLKHNDLLIQRSNSRELVGTSCIYSGGDDEYIYPDLIMRMRLSDSVDLKYIDYVLKSPMTRKYYSKKASGTSESMPKINQSIVSNTMIPLPPLAEQHRIVARVDELLLKIDELEKIEKELEELKKAFPEGMKAALLQSAMQGKLTEQSPDEITLDIFEGIRDYQINDDSVPFGIPENWEWTVLSRLCDMSTGNSISESEKKLKYAGQKNGLDYIGTKDVNFDHTVSYDNGVRIPDSKPFRVAKPMSILLCIEGGSAGKKIAIIDREVCYGNKLCAFSSDRANYRYIYYYLQAPDFANAFRDKISGIIGGVSIGKLKQMPFPVPPLAEQKRIVEKLDKLLPLCDGLIESKLEEELGEG